MDFFTKQIGTLVAKYQNNHTLLEEIVVKMTL